MESKSKLSNVTVLIPMYDEEKVAAKCIDAVMKVIRKMKNPVSLIVVNDGSRDQTPRILSSKIKQYPGRLMIINHKKNKGYGAALRTGMRKAFQENSDWILHMDSDLTNDPKYIPHFVRKISPNIDCIKASRYINKSKTRNVPLFRRFISIAGNFLAAIIFNVGIKDCTNGFRLVRTKLLKDIKLKENNFSIILEELYYLKKKKAKFAEIPYTLTARSGSKSHFRYKPKIFYDYFKYVAKAGVMS